MSAKIVVQTIAKVTGIRSQDISQNDYLEEDLEMDDIDIDEVLEILSDHFDIDIARMYDYQEHTQVKHIVSLLTEQEW